MSMRTAGAVTLALLAFFAGPAESRNDRSVLLPQAWGGRISVGYDTNLLGASRAEKDAFGTDDPGYWFVVDRMDDLVAGLRLWGEWGLPSFAKEVKVGLAYQRSDAPRDGILGHDHFELQLKQKLPDRSRIVISIEHTPQLYLRHRFDRDAIPGEPRFRPEVVRTTEFEIGYRRDVLGLQATPFLGYEIEDRNRWFDERDERTRVMGLDVGFPSGGSTRLGAGYEYNRSRSRNAPDLGSDRSYSQHVLALRWNLSGSRPLPWLDVHAGTRWKRRTYTTDNVEDESRHRRRDWLISWNLEIAAGSAAFSPFIGLNGARRFVDLPVGASASDEEGESEEFLIQTGVKWEGKAE